MLSAVSQVIRGPTSEKRLQASSGYVSNCASESHGRPTFVNPSVKRLVLRSIYWLLSSVDGK